MKHPSRKLKQNLVGGMVPGRVTGALLRFPERVTVALLSGTFSGLLFLQTSDQSEDVMLQANC